jgi:hypothetical protein
MEGIQRPYNNRWVVVLGPPLQNIELFENLSKHTED